MTVSEPVRFCASIWFKMTDTFYHRLIADTPSYENHSRYDQLLEAVSSTAPFTSTLLSSFASLPDESQCYRHLRKLQDADLARQSTKSAIAHQKGGRLKDAMRCYTRALQLNSLDIDALVGRGTLHTKMEDYTKGVLDLRAALRLDDQHRNARKYLETTLMRRGKHREQRGKFVDAAEDYAAVAELQGELQREATQALASVHRYLEKRASQTEAASTAARSTFGAMDMAKSKLGKASASTGLVEVMKQYLEDDKRSGHKHKKKKSKKSKRKSRRPYSDDSDDDAGEPKSPSPRRRHYEEEQDRRDRRK